MDRRSNKTETVVEHTRVRYSTSPSYTYQQGVSQPNEISVVAIDDSSVEKHEANP